MAFWERWVEGPGLYYTTTRGYGVAGLESTGLAFTRCHVFVVVTILEINFLNHEQRVNMEANDRRSTELAAV